MLTSLGFIFILGLAMAGICQRIKLPRIVGMLITGILLGPYVFNVLEPPILSTSAELREMALIIILTQAGLSINLSDLKKVGRPAIMMSFIPASFEILAFTFIAPHLLGISRIEGAVMGSVLAAVSPAVVVTRMVALIEKKYGTGKSIPQLIMAGASFDDIFVVVLFSTFVSMAKGGSVHIIDFMQIPSSIILGIGMGVLSGYVLATFFETAYKQRRYIRNSKKIVIILGVSFIMMAIEIWVKDYVAISGLLAVMSMATTFKIKSTGFVSKRLSEKLSKIWIVAEVILFVLVGAAVDIRYTLGAGFMAVLMIFISLFFRGIGVSICLLGTSLNFKERLFCIIAYIPKATVQAAIGSVPLAMGIPCGKMVLSVAVLAILITAPLGAIGIDFTYKRLLESEMETKS